MTKVPLSYAGEEYKDTGCLTGSVGRVSMNKFNIEHVVVVIRLLESA